MQFPIQIEQSNGRFTASVLGDPTLRVAGPTRLEAMCALTKEVNLRVERGDLATVEIPVRGVTTFAGIFSDDPTLGAIVEDAYRARDAEPYP